VNIRDEIARLSAEHDKLMSEHRAWLARREAAGAAPVQKSDDLGLVYKDHDNSEPAAASETDQWAGWNAWMRGHLDIERRSIFEEVEKALVDLVIELRKEWYEEMKKAITKRDAKIARLEGQVETLTRLYAGKSASIVDRRPKDVA